MLRDGPDHNGAHIESDISRVTTSISRVSVEACITEGFIIPFAVWTYPPACREPRRWVLWMKLVADRDVWLNRGRCGPAAAQIHTCWQPFRCEKVVVPGATACTYWITMGESMERCELTETPSIFTVFRSGISALLSLCNHSSTSQ
jgi:hypothetical protein